MLILQKDAGVLRTGGRGCQLRRPTVSCKLPLGRNSRACRGSVRTGSLRKTSARTPAWQPERLLYKAPEATNVGRSPPAAVTQALDALGEERVRPGGRPAGYFRTSSMAFCASGMMAS